MKKILSLNLLIMCLAVFLIFGYAVAGPGNLETISEPGKPATIAAKEKIRKKPKPKIFKKASNDLVLFGVWIERKIDGTVMFAPTVRKVSASFELGFNTDQRNVPGIIYLNGRKIGSWVSRLSSSTGNSLLESTVAHTARPLPDSRSYRFTFVLDPGNVFHERNENNNRCVAVLNAGDDLEMHICSH